MTGITEINKIVSKESKASEAEVKIITAAFLEAIKQELADGEEVSFKGYFSLTRSKKVPKEVSKFCDKHVRSVNDYKRTNKGKGINSFSKSPVWKKIMTETKSCNGCKAQKQKIVKLTKLLPRVNCKARFWESTSQATVKRKR